MNVLITKKISEENLDLIKSWGWNYELIETLKITLADVTDIPEKADAWIASSRNSFGAIKKFISEAPKEMYCVGDWMKDQIQNLIPIAIGTTISVSGFENMKSLAKELSQRNFERVIYFCGDEHRRELEEGLKNTATSILKVITHKSEMTFPIVKNNFDAVFVFSPRSAESLLKQNQFSPQTTFACIGSTTAEYLRSLGITNIFVSSYPDTANLLNEYHSQILNLKS
jgi:uroporphyrinogen-III synthase